jgi:hypothetical protein
MKTLIALLLALLVVSHAGAQPTRCPGGRFVVDGDLLDLGPPADRITALEIGAGDPPVVRVDGPCASAQGRRILRAGATVVRVVLEGCGNAPKTRLRIRLPDGCDGAAVRVRRAGVTLAER